MQVKHTTKNYLGAVFPLLNSEYILGQDQPENEVCIWPKLILFVLQIGMGILEYRIQKDPNPKLSEIQIET